MKKREYDDIIQGLALRKMSVDQTDSHGNTPLILACQLGSKKLVKLLLRFKADPNIQNLKGDTSLHFCFKFEFFDLAEYLIAKANADDTIENFDGYSCYD